MKKYIILSCFCIFYSCVNLNITSFRINDKRAVNIASSFLQEHSGDFYNKYCKNQTPLVESRKIENGKYKGLNIKIVTYNYSEEARNENSTLIEYAVKVYINSKSGKVITKITGPEGLGEIYDKETFQNFSPNILKLN